MKSNHHTVPRRKNSSPEEEGDEQPGRQTSITLSGLLGGSSMRVLSLGLLAIVVGSSTAFVPAPLAPPLQSANSGRSPAGAAGRRKEASELRSTMDGGGMMGGGGGDGMTLSNSVTLIGRLGQDPQIRYIDNGGCVASGTLAVKREMRGPASMDREEVDWIRFEAWGRQAEYLQAGARKGSRLLVFGRLITSSWTDKYGQNRNDLKVRARSVEVLSSRRPETNPELTYNTGWEEDPMLVDQEMPSGGGYQQQGGRKQGGGGYAPAGGQQQKARAGGGGGGGGRRPQLRFAEEPAVEDDLDIDTDLPF